MRAIAESHSHQADKVQEALLKMGSVCDTVSDLKQSVSSLSESVASLASTVRTIDGRSKMALAENRELEKKIEGVSRELSNTSTTMSKTMTELESWSKDMKKERALTPNDLEWWFHSSPQKIVWQYPGRTLAAIATSAASIVAVTLAMIAYFGPIGGLQFLLGIKPDTVNAEPSRDRRRSPVAVSGQPSPAAQPAVAGEPRDALVDP